MLYLCQTFVYFSYKEDLLKFRILETRLFDAIFKLFGGIFILEFVLIIKKPLPEGQMALQTGMNNIWALFIRVKISKN